MKQTVLLILSIMVTGAENSLAQQVPLVYDLEHTGAELPKPVLPEFDRLPVVRPLPDPFAWSDGSGRSTQFKDWRRRRAQIKAEIEHFGIRTKPTRPKEIVASFRDGVLTVKATENGETLTLTARVQLPDGPGPFPAVIGIGFGGGSGSLPPDIFARRGIARIAFNFTQVMSHTQKRGQEPINRLYPDLTHIGAYSAWSWGISRLIDGLELVGDELPIDRRHLAVTGCSFAGKMALFAGAYDERIALTIAQESGGRRRGGMASLGNARKCGDTGEDQQRVVPGRHVPICQLGRKTPLRPPRTDGDGGASRIARAGKPGLRMADG